MNQLLAVLRSSEFWVALGMAVVQTQAMPVPDEYKNFAWAYVGFRVVGKMARFAIPNGKGGQWFAND